MDLSSTQIASPEDSKKSAEFFLHCVERAALTVDQGREKRGLEGRRSLWGRGRSGGDTKKQTQAKNISRFVQQVSRNPSYKERESDIRGCRISLASTPGSGQEGWRICRGGESVCIE